MKTIRLGVIGASPGPTWAFTAHIPAIAANAGVRISAVATTRESSASEAARRLNAEAWFTDPKALAASDVVDAVAVVVKVPEHQRAVEAALDAGKPVYCEWPLALDAATARGWAERAAKRRVITAVGLQAVHAEQARQLAKMLHDGDLGEIRAIEAHASRARGLASRPVTASGAYTLNAANRAGTREVLGGHLLGLVDSLVEIESLTAGHALAPSPRTLTDDKGNDHAVTAPDTFAVVGRLSGGGLLSASWWDRDPAPTTRVVVHGSKGKAILDTVDGIAPAQVQPQMAPMTLTRVTHDGASQVFEPAPSSLPLVAQNVAAAYRLFLDDIRNDTRTSVSFADASRIHELLDTAVPASEAGSRTARRSAT